MLSVTSILLLCGLYFLGACACLLCNAHSIALLAHWCHPASLNALTNSLEQNYTWKAHSSSSSQQLSRIFGTQMFITAFTTARYFFLSWTRSVQSTPSHSISLRHVLILSCNVLVGLRSGLLSVSHRNFDCSCHPQYVPHAVPISSASIWSPE
jgi:hypothetical protein